MSESPKQPGTRSATVTDRGLNERRPLNEDSFLADDKRHIFAVADGVGGAEAGEVASKTSIEVIDEAFQHQVAGADIEDLMELAIQRANASIHQMSREHAKLSMMATTIVALHVNGNVATIGHVGDSRLYRLTPEGSIIRETADHSMVEEEVRAGRMTPEQAANHPGKNVISRALGAEETVDVDLKTIEVAEGTCFLLCSDGITRHIADHELRQVLLATDDLTAVCAELKRRCFDRGAEDNLTAVVVRVGEPSEASLEARFGARTLSIEHPPAVAAAPRKANSFAGNLDSTEETPGPASQVAAPLAAPSAAVAAPAAEYRPINIPEKEPARGSAGRAVARFFFFLLFLAGVGGAFYAGTNYRGPLPFGLSRSPEIVPITQPTPVNPLFAFEKSRRDVDQAPAKWLSSELPEELRRQAITQPLNATEPHFLYLYGRASLLSGNAEEAGKAFELAITAADQSPNTENTTIRKEAVLALAALAIKFEKDRPRALTHFDELAPKAAQPVK